MMMQTSKVGLVFNDYTNIRIIGNTPEALLELDNDALDYLNVVLEVSHAITAMDIAPFELVQDIDALFGTLNSKTATPYTDSIELLRGQYESIKELLEVVVANLGRIEEVSSTKLDQEIQSAITVGTNTANLVLQYETSNSKYRNMLTILRSRLKKLEDFNRAITTLEVNLLSLGEFAVVDSNYLSLKYNLQSAYEDTSRTTRNIQSNIDAICLRNQGLNKIALLNTEISQRLETLNSKASGLGDTLAKAESNSIVINQLLAKAQDKCAQIDEFLKCLVIYHAQMIRAGENTGVEKENKVFRIVGIAPPEPPCDEIVYDIPTTTVPPTAPPPTPGCRGMSFETSRGAGVTPWEFAHKDSFARPVGVTQPSDIKVTNPNNFAVMATFRFVVYCWADDEAGFRLVVNNEMALQALRATSSNSSITAPAIDSDAVRIFRIAQRNMQAQDINLEYRVEIPASGSIDLQLYAFLKGADNSGVDVLKVVGAYVTTTSDEGLLCGGGEQTIYGAGPTTAAPTLNPKFSWYPCGKASPPVSSEGEFYMDRAVTMQSTFRARAKATFNDNKYTKDMSYLKFVLGRFTYSTKTKRVFNCFCYTNSNMDGPYGIGFYDHHIEYCKDWVKFSPDYVYVETEDWQVMAEIYHNDGRYLR